MLHIDEVERVFASIAERDDWTPLEAKVEEVRALGRRLFHPSASPSAASRA